jgi:hypothetical protein
MTKMTNRKIFTGLALLLLLTASLTAYSRRNQGYYVNVFESEGGWGYDIMNNKEIIIHQPFIPAISGHHPFENSIVAKKTGLLVVKKLVDKKSPRISEEEVISLTGIRR